MSGLDLFGQVSTADTGVRSVGDFYETPAWMTRSLLVHHPAITGKRVLECASGRGAIARVLAEEARCSVVTNDINQDHPAQFHYDMRQGAHWQQILDAAGPFDYVVTNLPFNIALEILVHAVIYAKSGVATVLLKSFDEPTEDRGQWLSENPWTRKINQPRHSFRGEGSPWMASDWFIWEHYPNITQSPCVVDPFAKSRTRSLRL